MHEAVEDGGGHGGVAEVLAPVLHDAVGGDDDGAAVLVALVDDGLQQFGRGVADAPGQEQVVEHEQVGLDPGAQHGCLLGGAGQGVVGELGVGLDVAHVIALQRGLVGHGLGHMALAGAGLADDQRVGAVADELESVQLEAGRARQLGVEAPVEVGQGGLLVQARLLEPTVVEAGSPPVELVLQHGAQGHQERLLAALRLQHARGQSVGDAGEAQLAQGTFDLIEGHAGGSCRG